MLDPIRADLERRARAGDAQAIDILLDAVADGMPARTRRRWRDQAIVAIAAWLATLLPGLRPARAARMIVAAGAVVDAGTTPAARVFGPLTQTEVAELLSRMQPIVTALPRARRDGGWLTVRRVESILQPNHEI